MPTSPQKPIATHAIHRRKAPTFSSDRVIPITSSRLYPKTGRSMESSILRPKSNPHQRDSTTLLPTWNTFSASLPRLNYEVFVVLTNRSVPPAATGMSTLPGVATTLADARFGMPRGCELTRTGPRITPSTIEKLHFHRAGLFVILIFIREPLAAYSCAFSRAIPSAATRLYAQDRRFHTGSVVMDVRNRASDFGVAHRDPRGFKIVFQRPIDPLTIGFSRRMPPGLAINSRLIECLVKESPYPVPGQFTCLFLGWYRGSAGYLCPDFRLR